MATHTQTHTHTHTHSTHTYTYENYSNIYITGTYLNTNTRLVKNVPRLLRSGDELHLINPALVHIPGSNVTNQELLRNTYLVSIDLPSPRTHTQVTRAQTLSRGLQEVMGRSNTIVRLLNQDRSIRDHYEIRQELGRGTSGVVYLGRWNDMKFACVVYIIHIHTHTHTHTHTIPIIHTNARHPEVYRQGVGDKVSGHAQAAVHWVHTRSHQGGRDAAQSQA
ncbi:hypothetical protein EON63_04035 [archaeon]|nr:MAG: hypothetical protein EON63_04035 [archaeon]